LADVTAEARSLAERVARESYGRLVAFLAAGARDVPAAEDALADAFAAALQSWPLHGAPANPEGWLVVAARRRLIDAARRRGAAEAEATLRLLAEEFDASGERPLPDRRLALMFACAHPAIEESVRAPLMLQTILGLDAAAIASAFLVSPAAMGQRLSRAKTRIRLAGVPFREPSPELWPERIGAVLDAIYAAFSHGWLATGDSRGRNLAEEAIWLGRVAAELAPAEPEASGLLALMLYAHARRDARRDPDGRFVPLSEQDVAAWDHSAIDEAERRLEAAARLGRPGRYQLEAAIQSAHAARRRNGATDWPAIAGLYDALLALTGSAVVAVNRAVAISRALGVEEGLAALAAVEADASLAEFQAYWAARADLEARAGLAGAREAYTRAIGLESDPAVRAFLYEKLRDFEAQAEARAFRDMADSRLPSPRLRGEG
jgi:RNA polymerase sigma-70 factor, ECF subfamily